MKDCCLSLTFHIKGGLLFLQAKLSWLLIMQGWLLRATLSLYEWSLLRETGKGKFKWDKCSLVLLFNALPLQRESSQIYICVFFHLPVAIPVRCEISSTLTKWAEFSKVNQSSLKSTKLRSNKNLRVTTNDASALFSGIVYSMAALTLWIDLIPIALICKWCQIKKSS